MEEQNYKEIQENLVTKAEELKKKACEVEAQVSENINELMVTTAEKLDKAAEKMHSTAEFFRNNNVSKIKEDVTVVIRKNPAKSILAAIGIGFLVGKIILR